MTIVAITSALSVGVSLLILFSFIQNKRIHESHLDFQTIKYLEDKIPYIQKGSRWVQEHTGKVKKGIQKIDISREKYKKLPNPEFLSIQEEAKNT